MHDSQNGDEEKNAEEENVSKNMTPSKSIDDNTDKLNNVDNMVDKQQITQSQDVQNGDDETKEKEGDDHKTEQPAAFNGIFEFGELFEYWDEESRAKIYIKPEFATLKDEVMNKNTDHYLTEEKYNAHYTNAQELHSKHANKYKAKDKPFYNKLII